MRPTKDTTAEDLWQRYAKRVYTGVPMTPDRLREAKQDFISGCYAMMTASYVIAEDYAGQPDIPHQWICARKEEIEQFFEVLVTRLELEAQKRGGSSGGSRSN